MILKKFYFLGVFMFWFSILQAGTLLAEKSIKESTPTVNYGHHILQDEIKDPQKFYEKIKKAHKESFGKDISPDLQKKISQGYFNTFRKAQAIETRQKKVFHRFPMGLLALFFCLYLPTMLRESFSRKWQSGLLASCLSILAWALLGLFYYVQGNELWIHLSPLSLIFFVGWLLLEIKRFIKKITS